MYKLLIALLALSCVYSLRSTSQATMQATGPADALIDHLSAIETDIRAEQAEHDQLYNAQHAECEDEFAARTTAIVDGESALAKASAQHARCVAAGKEAEADLAQTRAYQTEIHAILIQLENKRGQQKADYERLVNDEIAPALTAVRGAYPIIDSFSAGETSFAQVTSHMRTTFKSMVKAKRGQSMAGALAGLAQLSAGFDQSQIDSVRQLFEQLEQDLVEAQNTATQLEQQRVQVYQETVAEYEEILSNLEATEAQLESYIQEMNACVVQEAAIVEQASAKVSNNRAALKYAIEMCGAFEQEYQNATDGRNTELDLIARLKQFVNEQAEIFGEYGPQNGGVFDAYRNEYETQLNAQVQSFIDMRAQKNSEHLLRMKQALRN